MAPIALWLACPALLAAALRAQAPETGAAPAARAPASAPARGTARAAGESAAQLWQRGRRAEAVEARKAELAGLDASAREPRLELVQWLSALHRYEAALSELERMPAPPGRLKGELLFLCQRYEEALDWLDAANPDHMLWIVDALEALGRFEELPAALDAAERVCGAEDARVLVARGRNAAREGRWSQAVACYSRARELAPLAADALYGLGQALLRDGHEAEGQALLAEHERLVPLLDALEFARDSLDLDPLSAHNHAALADAERDLGQLDEAERAYLSAESLAAPAELAPIALRLARFYDEQRRDLARALAVLARCEARCKDPRLPVRAGDLLARVGRRAEARAAYERALVLRPGDAVVRARLAALDAPASAPAAGGQAR